MLGNFKRQWRAFRGGKPGHRFQERYDRTRVTRKTQPWWQRVIQPFIALVSLAIGVVLTFLPGPGVVFYLAGAALLADESRALARGVDWSELHLRKYFHRFKRWWKQASFIAKAAVIFLAACIAGGALYLAYRIFFGK